MDNLPTKKDNFLAEVEVMDLSSLKDKTYVVGVASGNPDSVKFLCSTIHGPYTFVEMVQEVGDMWCSHQHHAKVLVLSKNPTEKVNYLSADTVDYIECHYMDIITEAMLGGAFDNKPFTCAACIEIAEHEGKDDASK